MPNETIIVRLTHLEAVVTFNEMSLQSTDKVELELTIVNVLLLTGNECLKAQ